MKKPLFNTKVNTKILIKSSKNGEFAELTTQSTQHIPSSSRPATTTPPTHPFLHTDPHIPFLQPSPSVAHTQGTLIKACRAEDIHKHATGRQEK